MASKSASLAVMLLAAGCSLAARAAIDACDAQGYRNLKIGAIRDFREDGNAYFDFRVGKDNLGDDGAPTTDNVAYSEARDSAVHAFAEAFRTIAPAPAPDADLEYSHIESASARCQLSRFFAFRVPVRSMHWKAERPGGTDGMLPAVKDLLRQKSLVQ